MSATLHKRSRKASGRTCKNADAGRAATFLITVAGSAGAFSVLRALVGAVPPSEHTALVAMLHSPSQTLVHALEPGAALPVRNAQSGDLIEPAAVYLAPGRHVIVNPDARLTVSMAPPVDAFRPSANWLFESAAASFGERHLAIVLSGAMWDGAASLRYVKQQGGTVWVQAPRDCEFADMPQSALGTGCVDASLPAARLATAIRAVLRRRDVRADRARWERPFLAGTGPALRPRRASAA